MDPLATWLRDFGWAGVGLYFVLEKVWPFLTAWILPERKAALARRAAEEAKERERLRNLEERQVSAFEKVAEAVQEMKLALVQTNERLTHVEAAFADHNQQMMAAIGDMRERANPRRTPAKKAGGD